jgi:DNA-binding Xre family transcriptional regulator
MKEIETPSARISCASSIDGRSACPYAAIRIVKECNMKRKRKTVRSAAKLATLDDFLKDQGKLEEFEAVAIKEVIAWQLGEAMKASKLSRKGLAERMRTSRSQVGRLLDPKDGNVTLTTLQRAAAIVGRKLRLELV